MKSTATAFLIVLGISSVFAQMDCPVSQPVLVYHEDAGGLMLFGGYCGKTKARLNDLWLLKETKWEPVSTDLKPPARSGHAMVYDNQKNRIILFGGKTDDGTLLNDTWEFSDNTWKKIDAGTPPVRQSHRLTFLKHSGSVLLFGGSDENGNALGDTWVFKNDRWAWFDSEDNPRARLQHTMACDEKSKKVVLFAGFDRTENDKTQLSDTWEWDESTGWRKVGDHPELMRDHHAMAYDPQAGGVILFGGYRDRYLGDTRSWTGTEWELLTNDGPAPRAGKPALVYSRIHEGLMLYGGGNQDNFKLTDLWKFNSADNSWKQIR